MLKKIFGLSRNEVTGLWRKLHNVTPHQNIIQGSKLRRIRWAQYVAHMGREVLAGFLWGNLRKRTTLKT
jgi:hypothetical protein